ncbi:uncharacterized protein [Coffea arabica]|uniref:Uncharacterized protein n=1 Tax=Coffea arabica TaxID=13443 RepID=A0ABM4WW93_COFAR
MHLLLSFPYSIALVSLLERKTYLISIVLHFSLAILNLPSSQFIGLVLVCAGVAVAASCCAVLDLFIHTATKNLPRPLKRGNKRVFQKKQLEMLRFANSFLKMKEQSKKEANFSI